MVTLSGVASSDPDADPLTCVWSQTSGPTVVLSDPNACAPFFTAPAVGPGGATLGFVLVVDDGLGGTDDDDVVVTVTNVNDPRSAAGPRFCEPSGQALATAVSTASSSRRTTGPVAPAPER